MLEGFLKGLKRPEYIHVLIKSLAGLRAGNGGDRPDIGLDVMEP
ncbi:unnamed protein product [uncultured bacterium]|nr:unnamed protein product [uncultured bacterium]